jgi:hypothetical protein
MNVHRERMSRSYTPTKHRYSADTEQSNSRKIKSQREDTLIQSLK